MSNYNIYQTNLILPHHLGSLSIDHKSTIPRSTLSNWKKKDISKILGCDAITDNEISLLKEIAKICDIPAFTIYSARHTYAMALKRHGAPTNIIQDSLGHTTEEMTQNYLDSFENSVIDEYDELII